jgi:hypothetical protein
MFASAAFVPSEDLGSNPFSGTVTLYPERDCDSLFGLRVRTTAIEEGSCLDDTLLGLGGFKSFKFTRIGDDKDPTASPFYRVRPFQLFLKAFNTDTCRREPGRKTGEQLLQGVETSSGCVNTNAAVSAAGFSFRRIVVGLPLPPGVG